MSSAVSLEALLTLSVVDAAYIAATLFFILGLKLLGNRETARLGNWISAFGMFIAVVTTVAVGGLNLTWIAVGLIAGTAVGVLLATRVQMTSMPELVALFNGLGGAASLLVGVAEYLRTGDAISGVVAFAIGLAILIGGLSFTGSLIAFGKLAERLPGRPIIFPFQLTSSAGIAILGFALVFVFTLMPAIRFEVIIAMSAVSLLLGVLAVIRIGGADMPIVVSLLNSYSGIAASMAGFALANTVLVVTGALVGASGLILTRIMCKAMNRSLPNVLFGGLGAPVAQSADVEIEGEVKPMAVGDAYYVLESARNVVFIPGYGMAVAQAQHAVKELADLIAKNGADVRYCIHPVAGRMPGHMNVLLAEANVPYEQLVEPQDVNPTMETVDVAIVIGANDVVNPAAKEDKGSPLYGMPIIDAASAKTVFVLKRSMNPGFSGVENGLFYKPNSYMVFGDAKSTLTTLASEFKDTD
ncbi:MAG: NAD(P)(+) transhydrogenase (Re/Si-specific) subunit beta [Alphaproteobacteria bacterium]